MTMLLIKLSWTAGNMWKIVILVTSTYSIESSNKIWLRFHIFLKLLNKKYFYTSIECPKNWTRILGKCFYISAEQFEGTKKSYGAALDDCKLRQGRLYEPRDIATYYSLIKYHLTVIKILFYSLIDSILFLWYCCPTDRFFNHKFQFKGIVTFLDWNNWFTRGRKMDVLKWWYEGRGRK